MPNNCGYEDGMYWLEFEGACSYHPDPEICLAQFEAQVTDQVSTQLDATVDAPMWGELSSMIVSFRNFFCNKGEG